MRGSEISIAVGALDGHCVSLQGMSKLSTSAFSITAVVDADAVEFQGEMREWRRTADGGNINGAKFCPVCGNSIGLPYPRAWQSMTDSRDATPLGSARPRFHKEER